MTPRAQQVPALALIRQAAYIRVWSVRPNLPPPCRGLSSPLQPQGRRRPLHLRSQIDDNADTGHEARSRNAAGVTF